MPSQHPVLGEPSARFVYSDAQGKPWVAVYRFDALPKGTKGAKKPAKEFRPYDLRQQCWQVPPVRPLYGLGALAKASVPVVMVEGEKCADALNALGILTTTAFGGANGVSKTDLTPLYGREVIVWPDNDEAGETYTAAICAALAGHAEVRVLALETLQQAHPNLPKGWDVADAIAEGWDKRHLMSLLAKAGRVQDQKPEPMNLFAEPPGWGEPDMSVLQPRPEPPEMPLGLMGPFWAPLLRDVAESCGAPVDYVVASFLAASSALIGNSVRVSPWQGWEEPAFLWLALVGHPSSGKSPAMDPVMKILSQLEKDKAKDNAETLRQYEADALAAQFANRAWEKEVETAVKEGYPPPEKPQAAEEPERPVAARIRVADATPEALARVLSRQPKGVLVQRDELAAWLGSFNRYSGGGGGDRAFWLEAYGARSCTIDRARNGGESLTIDYMGASIIGGIQPDKLRSMVMAGDDDGLTARFLYVWPEPLPPKRPTRFPDMREVEILLRRLDGLSMRQGMNELTPHVLLLSDDAASLFDTWRKKNAQEQPEGVLAGWWGKMPGTVLRVALVMELMKSAYEVQALPAFVPVDSLEAATVLVDQYFKPMAARCYGEAALPDAERHAASLAKWILLHKPQSLNVRELYRIYKVPGLANADAVKAALKVLAEANWVRYAPLRTKGRSHNNWEVSCNVAI
jgi:5S rRNA maturation endonuclease (ribonuclease M5)